MTYLVNPIENIGNKTSYARLLISFFPRSGYEFLGISSARAEFYVSMVLNEEKDIYIYVCIYGMERVSFSISFHYSIIYVAFDAAAFSSNRLRLIKYSARSND